MPELGFSAFYQGAPPWEQKPQKSKLLLGGGQGSLFLLVLLAHYVYLDDPWHSVAPLDRQHLQSLKVQD